MGGGRWFLGWVLLVSMARADFQAPTADAQLPETLTVRFFAKVYLLPSEDAPLVGVAEDGRRLPVYRRKGAWTQVGLGPGGATGWFWESPAMPSKPLSSRRRLLEMPVPGVARFSLAAGAGLAVFLIAVFVGFRFSRKRIDRSHGKKGTADRMPCSLEGRIVGNGLAEILQFLETGRRTGMLSIEDGLPAGVINFQDGAITFAQTRLFEGLRAVQEILSLSGGTFQFFAEKRVRQSNCRLSAFEVLLHWAHGVDEAAKAAARPGG